MIAAIALTLALAPADAWQKLAGASFEVFAAKTEAICPARQFRCVTPGDLDGYQEDFVTRLTRRQRWRLKVANHASRECTGSPSGLSCPTSRLLEAMAMTGQLDAFVAFACADPPAVPRSYRLSRAHP